MAVYAIRCGTDGPIKLGHAGNAKTRRSELQVAHWEPLRIVRCWEGGEPEEQYLHERFASFRRRGEWFDLSDELLADVGLTEIKVRSARGRKVQLAVTAGSKLAKYLADNDISIEEFAKKLRVTVQAVYRYIDGQRLPRHATMRAIWKLTGGAVEPNDFYPHPLPRHITSFMHEAAA